MVLPYIASAHSGIKCQCAWFFASTDCLPLEQLDLLGLLQDPQAISWARWQHWVPCTKPQRLTELLLAEPTNWTHSHKEQVSSCRMMIIHVSHPVSIMNTQLTLLLIFRTSLQAQPFLSSIEECASQPSGMLHWVLSWISTAWAISGCSWSAS